MANQSIKAALERMWQHINIKLNQKAPAYTCGTTDLTEGTSELETGKLYFVYEE